MFSIAKWVELEVKDWKQEDIMEKLRDLIYLHADLPSGSFEEPFEAGNRKLQEFWATSFERLKKGNAGADCQLLQDIVAEAVVTWSNDSVWLKNTEDLAEMMTSRAAQALVEKFLASWEQVASRVGDESQLQALLEDLEKHSTSARGVALPSHADAKFKEVLDIVVNNMALTVNEKYPLFLMLYKVLLCAQPWLSGPSVATLDAITMNHKLKECWLAFRGSHTEVSDMLDSDKAQEKLADVMRQVKVAEKFLSEPPGNGWQHGLVQVAFDEAKAAVAKASELLFKKVVDAMTHAIQNAGIAQGLPDGKSWLDGLGDDVTWDTLLEHAQKTLLTVPKKELENLEGKLTEDTWGSSNYP
eukprot:6474575-Amphidinium_carterae.1